MWALVAFDMVKRLLDIDVLLAAGAAMSLLWAATLCAAGCANATTFCTAAAIFCIVEGCTEAADTMLAGASLAAGTDLEAPSKNAAALVTCFFLATAMAPLALRAALATPFLS